MPTDNPVRPGEGAEMARLRSVYALPADMTDAACVAYAADHEIDRERIVFGARREAADHQVAKAIALTERDGALRLLADLAAASLVSHGQIVRATGLDYAMVRRLVADAEARADGKPGASALPGAEAVADRLGESFRSIFEFDPHQHEVEEMAAYALTGLEAGPERDAAMARLAEPDAPAGPGLAGAVRAVLDHAGDLRPGASTSVPDALLARLRDAALDGGAGGGSEPWETLDTCPSKGEPLWVVGGFYKEPERRKADGDWWRRLRAEGGSVPTHWCHDRAPAPPVIPSNLGSDTHA